MERAERGGEEGGRAETDRERQQAVQRWAGDEGAGDGSRADTVLR